MDNACGGAAVLLLLCAVAISLAEVKELAQDSGHPDLHMSQRSSGHPDLHARESGGGHSPGDVGEAAGVSEARKRAVFQKYFIDALQAHGVDHGKAQKVYAKHQETLLGESKSSSGKLGHIWKLKKQAQKKAAEVLELEGERSKLIAENAMHPSSVPAAFDTASFMDKPDNLKTPSTSEKYMSEANDKFLEKERAKMKKALKEEYQTHKDKQWREQQMKNIKKGVAGSSDNSDDVMKAASEKDRVERLARLHKVRTTEQELVARFEHLKRYRKKMNLPAVGALPTPAPGPSEDDKTAPKPVSAKKTKSVEPVTAEAEGAKSKPTKVEGVSPMGPTHRRRNAPASKTESP